MTETASPNDCTFSSNVKTTAAGAVITSDPSAGVIEIKTEWAFAGTAMLTPATSPMKSPAIPRVMARGIAVMKGPLMNGDG